MTAPAPCECTGIKPLSPTMKNIHMDPEKSQLTVHNSSPQLLKGGGGRTVCSGNIQTWGGVLSWTSPRTKVFAPFCLRNLPWDSEQPSGIITHCLSSDAGYFQLYFASWNEWFIKFFFSEFYMIIYTKSENVIPMLPQYVLRSDFNTKVRA